MPMVAAFAASVVTAISTAAEGAAAGLAAAAGASLGGQIAAGLYAYSLAGSIAGAALTLAPLAIISGLLTPHVNESGSPQDFRPDPNAPVMAVMGRYGVAGKPIYVTTSGGGNDPEDTGAYGNKHLTNIVALSGLGPIESYETLRANDTYLTFGLSGDPQQCNGGYIPSAYVSPYGTPYVVNADGTYDNPQFRGRMTLKTQLGLRPSPAFTQPTAPASDSPVPEWGTTHCISGFACAWWDCEFDARVYSGGVPQPTHTIKGYWCYDPRKDSTYPGGAGSQRWNDRSTWAWSQNPFIHALNYALGHWYPDPNNAGQLKLYAGIGAAWTGVNIAAHISGANVADANGWVICGQWTTGDGKWSVYSAMLQAGGGEPVIDRGMISCTVSTPLTSLGTITANDLAGDIQVDATASMRERINTAFVGYSSEVHRWQVVQVTQPVIAETYVTEDGGRTKSTRVDYQYIPDVNQACQIAAYGLVNNREGITAVIPGKPKLRNYKVGDAIVVDIDEAGLSNQKMVVRKRSTDISTGIVTLTCRSETDAKHAYALGQSGVAPPTPSISGVDPSIVAAPAPGSWSGTTTVVTDTVSGSINHVIEINGSAIDNVYAASVIIGYQTITTVAGEDAFGPWVWDSGWPATSTIINLILPPGRYHIAVRYLTISGAEDVENFLDLGDFTVGGNTSANTIALDTMPAAAAVEALNLNVANIAAEIMRGTLLGSVVGSLQGTVDGVTSQLALVFEIQSDGTAQAILAVDANGNVSGLVDTNTGTRSDLVLVADVLTFASPDGATKFQLFNLPNGASKATFTEDVEVDGSLLVTGSVTVDGLGDGAATASPLIMNRSVSTAGPGTVETTIFEGTLTLDAPAVVYANASIAFQDGGGHSSDSHFGSAKLYVNGTVVDQNATSGPPVFPGFSLGNGLFIGAAGDVDVKLTITLANFDTYSFASLFASAWKKPGS